MATRKMKLREPGDPAPEAVEPVPETGAHHSQRRRPEAGRYLLQVDRQTKGSYTTIETAVAAGTTIKTGYPLVHVSVYDSIDYENTIVEVPVASA
jgi:hypothetical protein